MYISNFLYSIKDFSKDEQLSIIYYICNIYSNYDALKVIPLYIDIYLELVVSLNLEAHSGKVIDAIIKKLVEEKFLNVDNSGINYFKDFDGLEVFYKEDEKVYNKYSEVMGLETLNEINLARVIFSGKKDFFLKLLVYTFYLESDEKEKTFTIPKENDFSINTICKSQKISSSDILIKAFNFSKEEGELLTIAYFTHIVRELNHMNSLMEEFRNDNLISLYSKYTGLSVKKIKSLLRSDKKLVNYGIMNKNGDIDEDVIDSIYTKDLNVLFATLFCSDDKKEFYNLNSFPVKANVTDLVLRLLSNENPVNILLYGSPGSGKTEYARSLVKKLGLNSLIFKNNNENDEDDDSTVFGRLNGMLSLQKKDSIIIVDEAESVLSTSCSFRDLLFNNGASKKKGIINTMLESNLNKVIWIVNYTSPLDESTLRRFTYSIRFNELSKTMMQQMADSKLKKLEMSDNLHNQLVELCGKYHVTGASVDNMIKTVKGMDLSQQNEDKVVEDVNQVLEANSTLLYGKSKIRGKVSGSYDLSVLNTPTPANEIVNMVLNAQSYAERNGIENNGIRMLFYGLSGTGKTELARYIAERLNKRILLKRASDILSKYVGDNETNIRKAFEEAESSGDVLLFDEADSFFANRTSVNQNWERTTVNEFLTQMEEFNGILICTTNLRQIMDPALQRRFHILSEFKPLEKEGIEKLSDRYFHDYKLSSSQIEILNQYGSVTPGDFSTLASKIRFMNASNINSDLIYSELCKIQDEKSLTTSHKIGFSTEVKE